jgi:hypothetical protein
VSPKKRLSTRTNGKDKEARRSCAEKRENGEEEREEKRGYQEQCKETQ